MNANVWPTFDRWFKKSAESFIKVPVFGAISYLTLAVAPFCVAFATIWAVKRQSSFAWIGQDILVSTHFTFVSFLCLLLTTNCALYVWRFIINFLFHQGIALMITVLQIIRIPNLKVIYWSGIAGCNSWRILIIFFFHGNLEILHAYASDFHDIVVGMTYQSRHIKCSILFLTPDAFRCMCTLQYLTYFRMNMLQTTTLMVLCNKFWSLDGSSCCVCFLSL